MKYNWRKNIEGKGYIECDFVDIFGSFNIPLRVRKIQSKMFGTNIEDLEWLHAPGQYLQAGGRFRTILRESANLPNLYVLTNAYIGYYDNERNFNRIIKIKQRDLLSWITKQNGVTTREVEEYLDKPNQSILNILNSLMSKGLLRQKKLIRGSGRPIGFGKPFRETLNTTFMLLKFFKSNLSILRA